MTEKIVLPKFQKVQEALASLGVLVHPSHMHGTLSALLCGSVAISERAWVDAMLPNFVDAKNPSQQAAHECLTQVFINTKALFDSTCFEFKVLLPDDEEPLCDRIEAISTWAEAFLSTLKVLGIDLQKAPSPELQEAFNHLVGLICLEYDPEDEADEEAEKAYVDLEEYLRWVVQLLYQSRSKFVRNGGSQVKEKKPQKGFGQSIRRKKKSGDQT